MIDKNQPNERLIIINFKVSVNILLTKIVAYIILFVYLQRTIVKLLKHETKIYFELQMIFAFFLIP